MTLKQVLKILKHYQKWRKGETDIMKYEPKQISEAIDVAINLLTELSKTKP